jgi:hypothetical protein
MKTMLRQFVVKALASVAITLTFQGQATAQDIPDGWTPFSSAIDETARFCGSYAERDWEVKLEEGRLKVSEWAGDSIKEAALPFTITNGSSEAGLEGDRYAEKVDDGWLVGFDAGEWGGALWWFSEDGRIRKKLTDENITGFVRLSAGIFALAGLVHLQDWGGKVLRVEKNEGDGWKATEFADLTSAPVASVVESPESILVLTWARLVRVRMSSGTVEVISKTNYEDLNPNSLALGTTDTIFVGMRHFITRLTPTGTGYKEEWFVPEDCQRFERRGEYDCVCLGATPQ